MTETSAPAEVVQTPSWPPTEAQLNEWLATIVEAWWSAASATYIRSGKLQATDIKAKYALREIIRPWAEAAHQATRIQPLAADAGTVEACAKVAEACGDVGWAVTARHIRALSSRKTVGAGEGDKG